MIDTFDMSMGRTSATSIELASMKPMVHNEPSFPLNEIRTVLVDIC